MPGPYPYDMMSTPFFQFAVFAAEAKDNKQTGEEAEESCRKEEQKIPKTENEKDEKTSGSEEWGCEELKLSK